MDARLLSREDENAADTSVTREDQEAINSFSTLHQKSGVIHSDLAEKKQEAEYLSDVTQELELADEDELVPYKIGDSFVHLGVEEVQSLLGEATERIEQEIREMEENIEANEKTMSELKVKLYAKFGKAINLDV